MDQTRTICRVAQFALIVAFIITFIGCGLLGKEASYFIKFGLLLAPWILTFIVFQIALLLRVLSLDIPSKVKGSAVVTSSLFVGSPLLLLVSVLAGI